MPTPRRNRPPSFAVPTPRSVDRTAEAVAAEYERWLRYGERPQERTSTSTTLRPPIDALSAQERRRRYEEAAQQARDRFVTQPSALEELERLQPATESRDAIEGESIEWRTFDDTFTYNNSGVTLAQLEQEANQRIIHDQAIQQAREIDRLRERLDDLEASIDEAEDNDRPEDAEDFRVEQERIRRQLRRLQRGDAGDATRGVVSHNTEFEDFSVSSQKTQVGLVRDNGTRLSFSLMFQTNRGSYQRRIVSIGAASGGLVFRRLPIRREMSHGFHVVHRRDVDDFVILERKEANADTPSR